MVVTLGVGTVVGLMVVVVVVLFGGTGDGFTVVEVVVVELGFTVVVEGGNVEVLGFAVLLVVVGAVVVVLGFTVVEAGGVVGAEVVVEFAGFAVVDEVGVEGGVVGTGGGGVVGDVAMVVFSLAT